MFYTDYSGVRPDIMVMAKGLANGFPLSAIVSQKAIMDKMAPGTMVGRFRKKLPAPTRVSLHKSNFTSRLQIRVERTRATLLAVLRQWP